MDLSGLPVQSLANRLETPHDTTRTKDIDMAKGHLCPICGTHTVQPKSTNKLWCSKCKTVFDKATIVG